MSSSVGSRSSSEIVVMMGASSSSCDKSRIVTSAVPALVCPELVSADAPPLRSIP